MINLFNNSWNASWWVWHSSLIPRLLSLSVSPWNKVKRIHKKNSSNLYKTQLYCFRKQFLFSEPIPKVNIKYCYRWFTTTYASRSSRVLNPHPFFSVFRTSTLTLQPCKTKKNGPTCSKIEIRWYWQSENMNKVKYARIVVEILF